MEINLEVMKTVFIFLFGKPNEALYAAATFVAVNFVLSFLNKYEPPKSKLQIFKEGIERIVAYAAFVIIAVRMDSLAVDKIFDWEGSTQFMVCIFIIGAKLKKIFNYFRAKGIEIPGVLDSRSTQLYNAGGKTAPVEQPGDLESKIQNLKQEIARMEQERGQFSQEDNRGGEQ